MRNEVYEMLHDLKIDFLDDGGVNLEQSAGCGESHYMTLHPVHLRFLAEHTGLITPSPIPTLPPSLQRRLVRIRDRTIEHHASMVKHSGVRNHDDEFDFHDESAALRIADELEDLLHDYSDHLNLVSADVITRQNQGDRHHDDHP